MPFDPLDFLSLAESLVAGSQPDEAQLRTAVGRAYYAVFLRAREDLLAQNRIATSGTGADHGIVVAGLRQRDQTLGDQLDWLRVRRARADYRLGSPVASGAASIVQVARSVARRL